MTMQTDPIIRLPALLRPELIRRIVWESGAVQEKFPGRFGLQLDHRGTPAWTGAVPVEGREVAVCAVYPASYPAVPLTLRTSVLLPPNCPHVLEMSGGWTTLCWIAPSSRRRARWDPQRHTAATALRAAQRWFLAYLVWQRLGRWPVPDAWDVDR
jgi:hypothetical protein